MNGERPRTSNFSPLTVCFLVLRSSTEGVGPDSMVVGESDRGNGEGRRGKEREKKRKLASSPLSQSRGAPAKKDLPTISYETLTKIGLTKVLGSAILEIFEGVREGEAKPKFSNAQSKIITTAHMEGSPLLDIFVLSL